MPDPHQLGLQGEQLAADYLEKKGYRIIARNYRYHRNEIDIIALHRRKIRFIEVKTRSSTEKGHPAEAVTPQKQMEIIKAARAYLAFCVEEECDCQFDVIAILVENMQENRIGSYVVEHFEDAFWANS
jgi:putative endonuclease